MIALMLCQNLAVAGNSIAALVSLVDETMTRCTASLWPAPGHEIATMLLPAGVLCAEH